MDELTLQKEVSDKYDLKTIAPGTYEFSKFGRIDLTALTGAQADQLVSRGFPFLVLKQTAAPATPAAPAIPSGKAAAPVTKTEANPIS